MEEKPIVATVQKILVVEDDPGVSKLICKKLGKTGFQTVAAGTGKEALELIRKEPPDLILLDYQLPGMDGREFAAKLQEIEPEIPFLTITGHGDEQIAVEMMKAGALDYLVKDAKFMQLLPEKVRKACRELETKRELEQSKAALKESEMRSKRILEAMKDPVLICDESYRVQYANPALLELTGRDRIHHCYRELFGNESPCEECPSVKDLEKHDLNLSRRMKVDGEEREFQVSHSRIHYANGSPSRLCILRDVTEIIRTRERAQESEEKFRLLADNAVDIVWQMDLRLRFTYLSPSAVPLLGYPLEEVIGHHLWEFTTRREFIKMARQSLTAIRAKGDFTITNFESELLHRDGHPVQVEIVGKTLLDRSGNLIGLQGSVRDISRRIEAQRKQRDQLALLRTLIDHMPDQIYVKDRASRFLINNTGHQKELKVSDQAALLHKTDFDFFDEETASEFYRDEQRIVTTGDPMINKEEYKTFPDGSHKWTLTTKVPIRDESGRITGIAGINRDITGRKVIEEQLLRSRYELSVRNKIAQIFLTCGPDEIFNEILILILKEFNSKFGYFGYINDRGELVCPSMTFGIFEKCQLEDKTIRFPKETWGGLWGDSLKEKRSLIKNRGLEVPDGHIRLQNAMSVPILMKNELIGQICIGNAPRAYRQKDREMLETVCSYISPILHAYLNEQRMKEERERAYRDLETAKEKAEESDRLKTSFLLNLSHELRTPLNAILGFSRVMADQHKEDEKSAYFAEQIDSAGQDLMKMVEDTIEMSRLQSEQVEIEWMSRKAGAALEEVSSAFSKRYSKSFPGIRFRVEDGTGDQELETDHDMLVKALMKVLDNAVKFTGEGEVLLGASLNGENQIKYWIKDTGIGIPAELQEAVFEKFRKIEGKKTLYRGNGLGLSIAKGLVEKIGGTIGLASEPDNGTEVTISIPLSRENEPVIQEP